MLSWPRKSRSTSASTGTWRYWWLSVIDSHSFFDTYVFEVEESISDIPSELQCLSSLKNPGQTPVQEDLRGTYTDDFVLWIFTISSVFMFSRSWNPFLTLLLGHHVCVTSKIKVNFRFTRYWWFGLMIFLKFPNYSCIWGQGIHSDIPTKLSYSGDLEIQVNFLFKRFSKVLTIVSYRFSQYLQYWPICFQGRQNICWHFYWTTMLGQPRKYITNSRFWRFTRSPTESSSCTEGCPGYSMSLKHGSSVGMPAMNSLTSKT